MQLVRLHLLDLHLLEYKLVHHQLMLLILNSPSFSILLIHLVFFQLSEQPLRYFLQVDGVRLPPNLVDPLIRLHFLLKCLLPFFIKFFELIIVFLSDFLLHSFKLLFLSFSALHRTNLPDPGFLLHQQLLVPQINMPLHAHLLVIY